VEVDVTAPQGINELLGRVLRYPSQGYALDLASIPARLEDEAPEAARLMRDFSNRVRDLATEDLQELYTRTFELSPVCALEVGWQLYGEEYARGSFLVFMRDALRRHEIPEETELPDHLAHVLPLLDRLSDDEANELSKDAVIPAIEKMLQGFAGKNNPYESVLRAIREYAGARWKAAPMEASHA
jgi:nitrate reductase assembly molybdenum cofactor insertion protein NarJ